MPKAPRPYCTDCETPLIIMTETIDLIHTGEGIATCPKCHKEHKLRTHDPKRDLLKELEKK